MKILIVIDDYYNNSNGMCISTQRFVKEFKRSGHQVRIMTNNRYENPDYPLEVLKIPLFNGIIEKEGYTFSKPQRKIIEQGVKWADIVHLEDPFFLCKASADVACQLNKPLTATFHLYPENMTYAVKLGNLRWVNNAFMRYFFNNVYNKCSYIQCPTKDVKERLESYGINGNLKVISNGIDPYFLNKKSQITQAGKLKIITVGRYAVEKNQKLLIEAIAKSNYKDDIELSIIGKGPLESKLRAYACKNKIDVTFGFLNQESLRDVMLSSDLYVHCADVEVEGMSCMEAFACGCVPIISDAKLSSTKSYALETMNSFKSGDSKDLAKKIDWFYENRNELNRLRKKYRQFALNLGVEQSAQRAISMFTSAIKEKEAKKDGSYIYAMDIYN